MFCCKETVDTSQDTRTITLIANTIGVDNPYYEGTVAPSGIRYHKNISGPYIETVKVSQNFYYE